MTVYSVGIALSILIKLSYTNTNKPTHREANPQHFNPNTMRDTQLAKKPTCFFHGILIKNLKNSLSMDEFI